MKAILAKLTSVFQSIVQAVSKTVQSVIQALFKNKIVGIGVVAVVLAIASYGVYIYQAQQKKAKELAAKKAADEERARLEAPSNVPLTPEQVIEREEKLMKDSPDEVVETVSPEELQEAGIKPKVDLEKEISPAAAAPHERVRRKAKYVKKAKDVPALINMLKTSLAKEKEGTVVLALKGLNEKGVNVVSLLREEIINNFDNPLIRRNAVWALFYQGGEEAIPVLKTVLMVDPDETVQSAALFSLNVLLGKDAVPLFERFIQETSSAGLKKKAEEYVRVRSISR